eukprot:TRINITY_DN8573_c0_g1_i1.p1 TRINITY_DN8573_c0_g1~~TRINITY_DN8573_c0_g1_i1.p1  ORF type:complete len:529 (-),score=120.16 TRINITY_DN8573_c0_g1_i1:65-1534(-)
MTEDEIIKLNISPNLNNEDLVDRSKYIPVRLSLTERKELRLLNAVLNVNDYTTGVDSLQFEGDQTNCQQRFQLQLKNISAILTGLVLSYNSDEGQKLLQGDSSFSDYEQAYKSMIEVGRRYKIMNPEKMRDEYGKLLYFLQDISTPTLKDAAEVDCIDEVYTVYQLLEYGNALDVLEDKLALIATMEIVDDGTKSRKTIQKELKGKDRAVDILAEKYSNNDISEDNVKLCLRSICDNNSFLRSNCQPIEKMLEYLDTYFDIEHAEKGFELDITEGDNGARLSHSHTMQYQYVFQSLTLWKNITNDMFKLWFLAEKDLLNIDNPYTLTDTGQGVNRLQQAPTVFPAMETLLNDTKQSVGQWIGSSKIHLGDHNVPNTLMFIDKYTQVPRIINPIINTIENIGKCIRKDKGLKLYVEREFGGKEGLVKTILCDFFRYAFDGSGADNFYDAGSCIDGRLTSAWNWCSQLSTKRYYHIFRLTGFVGFDGDFQQ